MGKNHISIQLFVFYLLKFQFGEVLTFLLQFRSKILSQTLKNSKKKKRKKEERWGEGGNINMFFDFCLQITSNLLKLIKNQDKHFKRQVEYLTSNIFCLPS